MRFYIPPVEGAPIGLAELLLDVAVVGSIFSLVDGFLPVFWVFSAILCWLGKGSFLWQFSYFFSFWFLSLLCFFCCCSFSAPILYFLFFIYFSSPHFLLSFLLCNLSLQCLIDGAIVTSSSDVSLEGKLLISASSGLCMGPSFVLWVVEYFPPLKHRLPVLMLKDGDWSWQDVVRRVIRWTIFFSHLLDSHLWKIIYLALFLLYI